MKCFPWFCLVSIIPGDPMKNQYTLIFLFLHKTEKSTIYFDISVCEMRQKSQKIILIFLFMLRTEKSVLLIFLSSTWTDFSVSQRTEKSFPLFRLFLLVFTPHRPIQRFFHSKT